jgi:tRNA A-37 threonylcarbamoyl transferase component Bud32
MEYLREIVEENDESEQISSSKDFGALASLADPVVAIRQMSIESVGDDNLQNRIHKVTSLELKTTSVAYSPHLPSASPWLRDNGDPGIDIDQPDISAPLAFLDTSIDARDASLNAKINSEFFSVSNFTDEVSKNVKNSGQTEKVSSLSSSNVKDLSSNSDKDKGERNKINQNENNESIMAVSTHSPTNKSQQQPPQQQQQVTTKVEISIGPQHFELLKLLGEGAFGKVILVQSRLNKEYYAMKVISKKLLKKKNNISYMKSERDILCKINHPFLITLKFAFQSQTKLFLVMGFLAGGELFLHLRKRGIISEREVQFYLGEMILAIDFLHSKGIIHRDLKPENILLRKDSHLCLTDFGLGNHNFIFLLFFSLPFFLFYFLSLLVVLFFIFLSLHILILSVSHFSKGNW